MRDFWQFPSVKDVSIDDRFWTPYLESVRTVMLPYVLDKFEEDGYLLVQYAISRHQYRIGYIEADAVSNLSEVAEIGSWANYPAQVLRTSALTDDPLNSCGAVMTLAAGQQVTYLGQLGQEWAFVETTTAQGQRIRGFVELSELNVTRPDDADDGLNG